MEVVDLSIESIESPEWNPNEMGAELRAHLRRSISEFGMVVPLVVRAAGAGRYETVGGAHRLSVLRDMGFAKAACLVVEANDAEARLLSQALNHIAGEDNLGRRAEVVRDMLEALPQEDILAILPESAENLRALVSIGETTIADQLQAWQRAQSARLRHLQFQLTDDQLALVEEALRQVPADHEEQRGSPNRKGTALTEICRAYLLSRGERT